MSMPQQGKVEVYAKEIFAAVPERCCCGRFRYRNMVLSTLQRGILADLLREAVCHNVGFYGNRAAKRAA